MNVTEQAVNTWGEQSQIDVAIGELAELIDVLIKNRRGQCHNVEVLGEIADVMIMVQQLEYIYGIDDVHNMYELKLGKLEEKLKHPERYAFR